MDTNQRKLNQPGHRENRTNQKTVEIPYTLGEISFRQEKNFIDISYWNIYYICKLKLRTKLTTRREKMSKENEREKAVVEMTEKMLALVKNKTMTEDELVKQIRSVLGMAMACGSFYR